MAPESTNKGGRRPVRIGKYEVLKHIQTGGMGAVYRAVDVELKRPVALKVLRPDLVAKPNMLERFRREAISAAKLRHENIVVIYEFGEHKGTYFLALEFVEGKDLHDYICKKGKLPAEEARQIVIQAARALDHAHQQGIVHRDIKPSNFLISKKDDKTLVKLTDLGLARAVLDDEYRVTTEGTTVGTVDYMSPEQAQDSSSADIRSDIYSLGCTFYHMLAGNAPFAQGSLPERLRQHAEAEPADVRHHNADVPEGLVVVLGKMLAKKPADRYQTPAELLKDLETPGRLKLAANPSDTMATLADLAQQEAPGRHRVQRAPIMAADEEGPATAGKPGRRKHYRDQPRPAETGAAGPAGQRSVLWLPWAAGVGVVAVAMLIIGIQLRSRNEPAKKDEVVQEDDKKPGDNNGDRALDPAANQMGPEAPEYPILYQPARPLDRQALRKEFAGSFGSLPEPEDKAIYFSVCRTAPPGPTTFRSLADAIARAPADQQTVIEIHDCGPLFEGALPEVESHTLFIRAGPGFRPLVVWTGTAPTGAKSSADRFLSLVKGRLVLDNLDFVVKWNETTGAEAACLFYLKGGDFQARQCTFSIAGKHPGGTVLARIESAPKQGFQTKFTEPFRCRLSSCYARGADLIALDLHGRPGDVLLNRSLLVGGDRPLLQVDCPEDGPTTLRLLRSTLVTGDNLLRIQPATGKIPQVNWLSWDTLLAHDPGSEGVMVVVPRGTLLDQMSWRPVNCLYAGWKKLLSAGEQTIAGGSLPAWHKLWKYADGDEELRQTWPGRHYPEPSEVPAGAFATAETPAGYAATSAAGTLGCDPDLIPPGPTSWLRRTFDRYALEAVALPDSAVAPAIATAKDGLYHGERVDLDKGVDLGQVLKTRLDKLPPAAKVVLHLTGQGEHATSPVRVKGIDLVLYFEPPKNPAAPLTLLADLASGDRQALIDVADGSLEMIGARIRFENSKFAPMPKHMIAVRGGHLRLLHCALQGPMAQGPSYFRGLIDFDVAAAAAGRTLAMHESILASAKTLMLVRGSKARLRIKQCVLVAAGDGVRLDFGRLPRMQWLFEHNTLAVAGALVDIHDPPPGPMTDDPLVINATANLFLAPFNTGPQACLLRCGPATLPRGLLLWQGKLNGFDQKRFQAYFVAGNDASEKQSFADWTRLWGPLGEEQPFRFDLAKTDQTTLSVDLPPPLEHLILPEKIRPAGQLLPGADFVRLGIKRR